MMLPGCPRNEYRPRQTDHGILYEAVAQRRRLRSGAEGPSHQASYEYIYLVSS